MATPSEKLADALEALHELQTNGSVAIRSADLSHTHRERLVQNGFLEEVIKGWYVTARPDETRGESTAWYASFWQFCAAYLNHLKAVRKSIEQIFDGHNAGEVVDNDHRVWYRELFASGVTAGIHKPADLAGYRNAPVFIRRSTAVCCTWLFFLGKLFKK